jgi:hypothetical protein
MKTTISKKRYGFITLLYNLLILNVTFVGTPFLKNRAVVTNKNKGTAICPQLQNNNGERIALGKQWVNITKNIAQPFI